MDAKSLFLTANADTVYSMGMLDLTKGPTVLEVPPKALGAIDDYWFRWVIDIGTLDARTDFFYGVTGITPAMAMRLPGIGSTYLWTTVDADINRPGHATKLEPTSPTVSSTSKPIPMDDLRGGRKTNSFSLSPIALAKPGNAVLGDLNVTKEGLPVHPHHPDRGRPSQTYQSTRTDAQNSVKIGRSL